MFAGFLEKFFRGDWRIRLANRQFIGNALESPGRKHLRPRAACHRCEDERQVTPSQ
jgi:hypothetical protein